MEALLKVERVGKYGESAAPSATAPAATTATETTPTVSATTPTATPTPTAAGAGLVEVIAFRRAAHSVLHVGVHALGIEASGRTILIKTLFVLLHVGLAVGMLLLVALRLLLGFLLCLLRVDVVPASVVVFLPAGARVLVNVAIVASIHIAAGILPRVGASKCRGRGVPAASLRALCAGYCTVGRGVVLGIGRFIALLHVGLSPLGRWTGTLVSRAICPGIGIVGLPDTLTTVGCGGGSASCVRAGIGIVLRSCGGLPVSTVGRI